MKIIGIETSCDETAASVVEDGVRILSNVVVSQIDIFKEYGGVIPEVAARSHLEAMMPVVNKALSDAGCSWEEIDAIAVTHAPGLLGSLLIGTLTARTLAILHNKPLYAVHHLKSHVYANWLNSTQVLSEPVFSDARLELESTSYTGAPGEPSLRDEPLGSVRNIGVSNSNQTFMHPKKTDSATRVPQFPLLALVISGGHTQILYMKGHNQFEIIGTTVDDAVGECFDKVAKILGLPYPGGPSIAKAAKRNFSSTLEPGRPPVFTGAGLCRDQLDRGEHALELKEKFQFPHPKVEGLNFSFSGLKTAVLRAVQKEVGVPISYPSHQLKKLLNEQQVCDFAASFQKTAIDILVEKLEMALNMYPDVQSVVVAGGVSANEELRKRMGISSTLEPGRPPVFMGAIHCRNQSDCDKHALMLSEIPIFFPLPSLSGDNGAMVAAAAYYEIQSGVKPTDPYALNIYPRVSIEE